MRLGCGEVPDSLSDILVFHDSEHGRGGFASRLFGGSAAAQPS